MVGKECLSREERKREKKKEGKKKKKKKKGRKEDEKVRVRKEERRPVQELEPLTICLGELFERVGVGGEGKRCRLPHKFQVCFNDSFHQT